MILGLVGVALIIAGSLELDQAAPSLPPIATASPVAQASPTAHATAHATAEPTSTPTAVPTDGPRPTETPAATPTPLPESVTAVQLMVPSVGINVLVRQSTSEEIDRFPPSDAAYILRAGNQPGRNTNSYIFAHAVSSLFKPLWNVQLGAEVLVAMSDDSVLRYVVTEIRPNVACPDRNATTNNPEHHGIEPPLALQIHGDCSEGLFWTGRTDYERLTLQTSQGYNRNWGELVIIAEPAA